MPFVNVSNFTQVPIFLILVNLVYCQLAMFCDYGNVLTQTNTQMRHLNNFAKSNVNRQNYAAIFRAFFTIVRGQN